MVGMLESILMYHPHIVISQEEEGIGGGFSMCSEVL